MPVIPTSTLRLMVQLPIHRNTAKYGRLMQTQSHPRARACRLLGTEQEYTESPHEDTAEGSRTEGVFGKTEIFINLDPES